MEYSHDIVAQSFVNSFLKSKISEITSRKSSQNRCYTKAWAQLSAELMWSDQTWTTPSSSSSFCFLLSSSRSQLSLPLLFLLLFVFLSFAEWVDGLKKYMIKIFNTLKGCDCCFVLPLHSFSILILRAHQPLCQITSDLNLKFFNYSTFYLFIL